MLARGAEDLADLRDQRLDVVADPALAELAEAGEVAADLGRVDVGVLGELLRGDRVAAHLARLGQHLQVAREARGDAQREAVPFDREPPRGLELLDHLDHAPTVSSLARTAALVQNQLRDDDPVDLDDRDSLEVAAQQQLVALDVDLVQAEAIALPVQGDERGDRLLAEVAAGARVDDDLGHAARRRRQWRRRRSRGSRDTRCAARSGRRSRSSRRCRCRACAGPASAARRAPRRAPPPPRAGARWRRRRRPAPRPPSRPASGPASVSRSAGRPRPPGRRRRGRRGARPRPPRRVRDSGRRAPS